MGKNWTKVGRLIESATRKALYDYQLVDGIDRIGVALSGGKDSLTLLTMLKAISGKGFPPFKLHAFHVSGAYSCGASIQGNWLQKFCDAIDVPLSIYETEMKLEKLKCYPCSRNRRKILFDAAKNAGIETIAFGHHRDDHVKTLLMNLLHKGEFAGNLPKVPMEDFGVTIIRPLIFVKEDQIRSFAETEGFLRVMCQCPVGQHSMRKQIDHLLTEMETLFPNTAENLASAGLKYGSTKAMRKTCNKQNTKAKSPSKE